MPPETLQLREARLEIHEGIATFTHLRAERRVPMSPELRQDYIDMLDRIEPDPAVRALILTGSGGAFCAGGDLKGLKDRLANPGSPANSPDAMRRRLLATHAWLARLRDLEMPVIAAVDGPAMGAGMSLALAADFVLASPRALFCMSFARMGLLPDMAGAYFLPRIVGMAMAKELMLTARRIDAPEARALGIVHSIHDANLLPQHARDFARRFLAGPPQAFGPAKRMLNSSFEMPYTRFTELEANAQAVATTTAYHADALRRFADGEAPLFDWDSQEVRTP